MNRTIKSIIAATGLMLMQGISYGAEASSPEGSRYFTLSEKDGAKLVKYEEVAPLIFDMLLNDANVFKGSVGKFKKLPVVAIQYQDLDEETKEQIGTVDQTNYPELDNEGSKENQLVLQQFEGNIDPYFPGKKTLEEKGYVPAGDQRPAFLMEHNPKLYDLLKSSGYINEEDDVFTMNSMRIVIKPDNTRLMQWRSFLDLLRGPQEELKGEILDGVGMTTAWGEEQRFGHTPWVRALMDEKGKVEAFVVNGDRTTKLDGVAQPAQYVRVDQAGGSAAGE